MPVHSRASLRYARALLLAAEQRGSIGPLREEVEALRKLTKESPELRAFLANPTIAKQDKLAIIEGLFGGRTSPLMSQFLRMLTDKYRERMLLEILDGTVGLLDEREGKAVAHVKSAADMTDDQKARLTARLRQLTGKELKLNVVTEPALKAGFVAQVGDTVFDASLDAQLRRLREALVQADLRRAAH